MVIRQHQRPSEHGAGQLKKLLDALNGGLLRLQSGIPPVKALKNANHPVHQRPGVHMFTQGDNAALYGKIQLVPHIRAQERHIRPGGVRKQELVRPDKIQAFRLQWAPVVDPEAAKRRFFAGEMLCYGEFIPQLLHNQMGIYVHIDHLSRLFSGIIAQHIPCVHRNCAVTKCCVLFRNYPFPASIQKELSLLYWK